MIVGVGDLVAPTSTGIAATTVVPSTGFAFAIVLGCGFIKYISDGTAAHIAATDAAMATYWFERIRFLLCVVEDALV